MHPIEGVRIKGDKQVEHDYRRGNFTIQFIEVNT